MTSKARGMPSVELSIETQEKIEADKIDSAPKPESEIFQKSNPELEIKPITAPPVDRPTTNLGLDNSRPTTNITSKPKRKLTEKQLEGLRKGREKSLETRRAAKAKKAAHNAPKNHIEQPPPQSYTQPEPTPQPAMYQQPPVYISQPTPSIDYDKIINGVADKWNSTKKVEFKKEEPTFDRVKFEADIRLNEKQKILLEIEQLQKDAEERENQKTTKSVYNAPANYSYAFENNSRKRYNRY
tara:strand:+ start:543 stop:1265 length:723 start_codon:yes stop_codon:yes gene_type:complete